MRPALQRVALGAVLAHAHAVAVAVAGEREGRVRGRRRGHAERGDECEHEMGAAQRHDGGQLRAARPGPQSSAAARIGPAGRGRAADARSEQRDDREAGHAGDHDRDVRRRRTRRARPRRRSRSPAARSGPRVLTLKTRPSRCSGVTSRISASWPSTQALQRPETTAAGARARGPGCPANASSGTNVAAASTADRAASARPAARTRSRPARPRSCRPGSRRATSRPRPRRARGRRRTGAASDSGATAQVGHEPAEQQHAPDAPVGEHGRHARRASPAAGCCAARRRPRPRSGGARPRRHAHDERRSPGSSRSRAAALRAAR